MGPHFRRSSSHEVNTSPGPGPRPYSHSGHSHSQSAHSQSSLFSPSSPVSQTAPVLPPIPRIADGPDMSLRRLDTDYGFAAIPEMSPQLSSSSASSPSPYGDMATQARPQRMSAVRSLTSPDGTLPKQKSMSPASPSVAFSVPYSTTTAQEKPMSGNRPLPAESMIKGVPQHAKKRPELHSNKSAKTKFNLLNPVNLLMRRRSAQAVDTVEKAAPRNPAIPPMDLPEDYDPRIRGKLVHDFSAPRMNRFPSYNDSVHASSPKPSTADDSFQSSDSVEREPKRQSVQHAPVFVEHIDDDQDQNRIHAETLANNDFIARNSWRQSEEALTMPPFGRKSQRLEDQQLRDVEPSSASSYSDIESTKSSPRIVQEPVDHQPPVSPQHNPPLASYQLSDHGPVSASRTENEWQSDGHQRQSPDPASSSRASGLPRHLTSTASRFSFQAANDSMAEEKLLEEKHRLRQSVTVREDESIQNSDREADDEDETFDENAMYDHDEMEDMNPTSFYEHRNSSLPERISGTNLESHQDHLSMASSATLYSEGQDLQPSSPYQHRPGPSIDAKIAQSIERPSSPTSPNSLYFDDGMIESINDVHEDEAFDEDNFDDPAYLKKPPQSQVPATSPIQPDDLNVHSVNGYPFMIQNPGTGHFSSDSPFSEASSQPGDGNHEAARHDSQQGPIEPNHGLAAYHSALAEAAHRAAADGKFTRQNSVAASDSTYSEELEGCDNRFYQQQAFVHQRFMSASTHQSRHSYSGFDFGFNDGSTIEDTFSSPEFPSDEFSFEDADIISAANAEALANDDEGFYSQEFGFYARSRSGSDPDAAEAINGGYFGPPGIEIIRQKSVKEPNLTPITERSEFSTRNSYIGPFSPISAALPPSPAFAPPHMAGARMSPLAWSHMQEDEMTLADLRRLKQGFGGSTGSLHSMTSSFGGQSQSPVVAPHSGAGYFMPRGSFGGVPMAWQRSSDSQSNYNPSNHSSSPVAASPIHMSNSQTFDMAASSLQPPPRFLDDQSSTPKKSSSISQEILATPATVKKAVASPIIEFPDGVPWQTHSRSGSGADNITYVREEDSDGAQRWVLERRRTSEAGLLELIGREIVEGGRI